MAYWHTVRVVYFIRNNLGYIKIGITGDVMARYRSLQIANPLPLDYFYGIMVENEDEARWLEQVLHRKFSHIRHSGEWFEEEEVIEWVSTDFVEIIICGHTYRFPGRNNWNKRDMGWLY